LRFGASTFLGGRVVWGRGASCHRCTLRRPPLSCRMPALRYGSGRSSLWKPNRWLPAGLRPTAPHPPQGGRLEASLTPPPYATSAIGESRRDAQSPPLRGRCPGKAEGGEKDGAFRVFPSLWPAAMRHPRHARFSPSGFLFSWEAGRVVRATLVILLAQTTRPAGAFAPDGWAGLVRMVLRRICAGQNHPALPARPSPRPGPVVGRFPPSHATVARPTRTPSPSPTPRSGAGFPQGRCRHYAGGGGGRGQNDGKDC
jgi:hypothetical protein